MTSKRWFSYYCPRPNEFDKSHLKRLVYCALWLCLPWVESLPALASEILDVTRLCLRSLLTTTTLRIHPVGSVSFTMIPFNFFQVQQFYLEHRDVDEVKKLVVSSPVLKFYDVDKEVTVQCGDSSSGLGATLLQVRQPVAFASRTLSLV